MHRGPQRLKRFYAKMKRPARLDREGKRRARSRIIESKECAALRCHSARRLSNDKSGQAPAEIRDKVDATRPADACQRCYGILKDSEDYKQGRSRLTPRYPRNNPTAIYQERAGALPP